MLRDFFIPLFALGLGVADGVSGFDFSPLVNVGVAGVVLAWILWKMEPRMRGIESSIDRLTRMMAVFLTELPHVMEGVKATCRTQVEELDRISRERGDQ